MIKRANEYVETYGGLDNAMARVRYWDCERGIEEQGGEPKYPSEDYDKDWRPVSDDPPPAVAAQEFHGDLSDAPSPAESVCSKDFENAK